MTQPALPATALPAADLPVAAAMPELLAALESGPNAVLVAPPGAGKTTLVPLALLDATWRGEGTILVLQPRRIAARATAHRLASLLGERVGQRVGYRVRFDTKVSAATRIEVVTGGVFLRRLASDPTLDGVAAVVFDEFHERSLDGDTGLALARDLQTGLREDLRLLPMSATLDAAGIAGLLGAPVVESAGRMFPVETLHRPAATGARIEDAMAAAVREALAERPGSVLAFLPGRGEIERTAQRLAGRLPVDVDLHRLYGARPREAQDAAIAPAPNARRKVVLATSIAETSLTIDGVRSVIDSGLARRPVFEPGTGLTRLATVRASRAAIAQRAGRAGRTAPGTAVRLWHAGQDAARPAFDVPEIETADLSRLALDLAEWGIADPDALAWLTPPPKPALLEARALLARFGALDMAQRPTAHGRAMHALPLSPRLANMVVRAARSGRGEAERAALLALVVQERDAGGRSVDLAERLERASHDGDAKMLRRQAVAMARSLTFGSASRVSVGLHLARAFPDRIAQAAGPGPVDHHGETRRFRLANGRAASLPATDPLASHPFLTVADMAGEAGSARIVSAAAITREEIEAEFVDAIETHTDTTFDPTTGALLAQRTRRLGAVVLGAPQPVALDDATRTEGLIAAIGAHGLAILPWTRASDRLRTRLTFAANREPAAFGPVDDATLLETCKTWLAPFLAGCARLGEVDLAAALMAAAGHPSRTALERAAPTQFTAPSGSAVAIEYDTDGPSIALRPQELFGLAQHPTAAGEPLTIELLSPAGRPIQRTRDLPGFWRGSWADVRADLRGRYPKHPWPEDPLSAAPTARAKPRKDRPRR